MCAARFSLGRRARALRRKETEASRRRSKLPGFQSWLRDLLAGRPWPKGSAFASLRFPGDEAEATTDVERPQKTARARGGNAHCTCRPRPRRGFPANGAALQPRSSVARVRRGVRGCCKVPGTAVGALQPDLPDD